MESLIEWLPKTRPDDEGVALVHGDYRIDNLIFYDASPELAAVVDWELSTIGDPAADFAKFLMAWVLPCSERSGLGTVAVGGIPSFDDAIDLYSSRTALDVRPNLPWYLAFNLFRHAAILQGVKKRVLQGNASSEAAQERAQKVPLFADLGWLIAQGSGSTSTHFHSSNE